ncbi:MAG: hypothetical protein KJI69_05675 [Patescibacteria group bacterium]|nr:hypothetical protein [Patescibacteria group bacterium]
MNQKQLIQFVHDNSYEKAVEKFGLSKGKIWSILKENNSLKYKDVTLEGFKTVYTDIWACGRPMGKYSGTYPMGFMKRLANLIDFDCKIILHLFSGSVHILQNHDTLDIKKELNPKIVADARGKFPIKNNKYDVVIADPPYDSDWKVYGKKLYRTDVVKPYSFVKEAVRVTKPSGYICILHHLSYKTPEGTIRKGMIGITTGPNMRIRLLNIFKKIK